MQADPIRSPARAQDLTLRPRVTDYRAGDLETHYATLPIEEDFFINYGFVTRRLQALMHPRASLSPTAGNKRAKAILEFVRERGTAHPREVDAHFAHGRVTNYWGGSSSATTHMLELMHYKGMLRVARREAGIRIYAVQQHGAGSDRRGRATRASRSTRRCRSSASTRPCRPRACRSSSCRLRYATPHWHTEIKSAHSAREAASCPCGHRRAHLVLAGGRIAAGHEVEGVRLLAPFDPVVWDRRRFEMLWDWAYRFEAYTPAREAQAWLLRAADDLAQSRHRVGQHRVAGTKRSRRSSAT